MKGGTRAVVGVESGDGERAVGIVNEEGLAHLDLQEERRVELWEVLKDQGLGELGGVDGKRRVERDLRAVIFVGMSKEMVAFSLRRRRPCIHREGKPFRHLYRHLGLLFSSILNMREGERGGGGGEGLCLIIWVLPFYFSFLLLV